MSGELIDANTNSWSVVDTTDEKHSKLLKDNNIELLETPSMLSEEDEKIESDAQIAFMSAM